MTDAATELRRALVLSEPARAGRPPRNGHRLSVATEDDASEGGDHAPPHTTGYSATELVGMDFPEAKYAVDGVLPEGLTILAGRPKTGKSWLGLGLSLAIASGGMALGKIPVERGEVLNIALEDNPRRLQRRLQQVLGDEPAPEGLRFETSWPRADQGGIGRLEMWLSHHPATRLVVIDTLARFRPVVKDGGYSADYAAIAPLQEMAGRHQVSIVMVHHQRKLALTDNDDWIDSVSGTLGLAGASDGLMCLFKVRGSRDAILKITHRDQDDKELGLRFDAVYATWTLEGDASRLLLTPERTAIVDLLVRQGPLSPAGVATELHKNASTVRTLLQKMASSGQILVLEGSRYAADTKELI